MKSPGSTWSDGKGAPTQKHAPCPPTFCNPDVRHPPADGSPPQRYATEPVDEDPDKQLMESKDYSSPEEPSKTKSGRNLSKLFGAKK